MSRRSVATPPAANGARRSTRAFPGTGTSHAPDDHRPSTVAPATVDAQLYVIAGVDGAGRSSIGGAAFRAQGADVFDPDALAARMRVANPRLDGCEAAGLAWRQGRRLLERAMADGLDHAFETTLGAHTIPALLADAASRGFAVRVWYVGLDSPELHLRRVQSRVARGGHDVPEALVRRRFSHSRLNLIALLPCLSALRLYDNSAEADPATGVAPLPRLVLHLDHGRVVGPDHLATTPEWARPIVAAALKRAC